MVKVHNIDPNADTVIILKNPLGKAFALEIPPPPIEPVEAEDTASSAGLSAEECSAKEPTAVEGSEPDDSSPETIEYHVSSSVLKLASPNFDCMLSGGNWKECTPDEDDGKYHITVEDWDEDALLILLNTFHFRNRDVPKSLSIDMVAKVAMLVEYYNCAMAVELWGEIWINSLKKSSPIPSESSRELMLWIYITWVFQLSEDFTLTTAVAIKKSKQNQLSISDLPIPRFVEKIDQARIQAIGTIFSKLHDLLISYRSASYRCSAGVYSFECSSIHYGALTKGMDSFGLLSPYPEAPYSEFSVDELCKNVRNMKSPVWFSTSEPPRGMYINNNNNHKNHSSCRLSDKLQEISFGVEKKLTGLYLQDFVRT